MLFTINGICNNTTVWSLWRAYCIVGAEHFNTIQMHFIHKMVNCFSCSSRFYTITVPYSVTTEKMSFEQLGGVIHNTWQTYLHIMRAHGFCILVITNIEMIKCHVMSRKMTVAVVGRSAWDSQKYINKQQRTRYGHRRKSGNVAGRSMSASQSQLAGHCRQRRYVLRSFCRVSGLITNICRQWQWDRQFLIISGHWFPVLHSNYHYHYHCITAVCHAVKNKCILQRDRCDFRPPPPRRWELRSSGLLRRE